MDKDRLIKLLREECEGLWQCEGTSYLDKEEGEELHKLLEEYDVDDEPNIICSICNTQIESGICSLCASDLYHHNC